MAAVSEPVPSSANIALPAISDPNFRLDNSEAKASGRPLRRKKASRACSHCQKAHLTCDDSRPCQRCVRKGLAEQCVDGFRKKAKYLLEEDEIAPPPPPPALQTQVHVPLDKAPEIFGEGVPINGSVQFSPSTHVFEHERMQMPFDGAYGLDTTSLEYSILSSMLHDSEGTVGSDSPDSYVAPIDKLENYTHGTSGTDGTLNSQGALNRPLNSWSVQQQTPQMIDTIPFNMPFCQDNASGIRRQMANVPLFDGQRGIIPSDLSQPQSKPTGEVMHEQQEPMCNNVDALWRQRVSQVYNSEIHPHRYTEGYHILLKYVTQNFEKADVLRIVRALAIFRPSLIALQMALSEEDEIFVERAFQRTILEFEKLVSFSGTPTVVWRRTCEISLVGTEFCMLTKWSKEDLLGKFIYQFMDKNSVLNYWEKFASHAFENTTQSVMTTCVLLSPTGQPIHCAWCFTIKRDPFDLPGYIVGNFLPILS